MTNATAFLDTHRFQSVEGQVLFPLSFLCLLEVRSGFSRDLSPLQFFLLPLFPRLSW